MQTPEPSAAPVFDVRLVAAAAHPCVYADGDPKPCPVEWPGQPWKWCGACLAKEITRDAA